MAPLEINIPSNTRSRMSFLKIPRDSLPADPNEKSTKPPPILPAKRASRAFIDQRLVAFPELHVLDVKSIVHDVEVYANAFDESMKIIHDVIDTDIWPRFTKSASYVNAIRAYAKASSI